jgi:spoIIIJ-associated protein
VREQLLEDLRRLAVETAERVRRTGEPETMAEMNPAERRIVHLTLSEDPAVATESLGTGTIKRIQIRPR